MKIRMIDDLLLIQRSQAATRIGSIELAPGAVEELQEGVVIAAGPGKRFERRVLPKTDGSLTMQDTAHWIARPMDVAVGDRVLFSQHGHQRVKLLGQEYVTLHEESVVAVIPEPEPGQEPAEPLQDPVPDPAPLEEDETAFLDESVLAS
jgi:chaperonin GroES